MHKTPDVKKWGDKKPANQAGILKKLTPLIIYIRFR
jgi:hypothetical protein